jgi:hypothetical protein
MGSSHGSNKPDTSGDETDHRDELICCSNFSASGGYITDDELRAMLANLRPGVKCYLYIDSCYSGTVTRVAPQVHNIPVLDNRFLPFPAGKVNKATKETKAVIVPTMKEVLNAACGEGQTSAEVSVSGVPRGLASYYWQKAITTYPTYTNDQLMNWVKVKVAAVVPSQVPQLECTSINAVKQLFS